MASAAEWIEARFDSASRLGRDPAAGNSFHRKQHGRYVTTVSGLRPRRRIVGDISVFNNMQQLHNRLHSGSFINFPPPADRPRNTRLAAGLHDRAVKVPASSTQKHLNSFICRTSRVWNGLPDSVVSAASSDGFRSSLHRHLKKENQRVALS